MLRRWLTCISLLWLALTSQVEARYARLQDFGRIVTNAGSVVGDTIFDETQYLCGGFDADQTPGGSDDISPVPVRGFTNSPATVTVNGSAATPGNKNMFSLDLRLSPGTQTISIAATANGMSSTRSYTVSVSSTTLSSKLAYDANGNTLYDGVNTYDYDAADRLIRIRNGSTVVEFVYDGLGRRVAEWDNGSLAKQWVWAGSELCEERDASDTVTKRFFPQGEQISGTAYYYSRDHLGSIREMTDSSGTIHARYSYDPYGVRAANTITTSAVESDFGFTGDYYNATFGLDLTLYRAYNPVFGRWLNWDPIGEQGGLDLYGYVGNDPLNLFDLSGQGPDGVLTLTAGGAAILGTGVTITETIAAGTTAVGSGIAAGAATIGTGIVAAPVAAGAAIGTVSYAVGRGIDNLFGTTDAINSLYLEYSAAASASEMARHESGQRNYINAQAAIEASKRKLDVCVILDMMMTSAKISGNTKLQLEIKQAQKAAGCRQCNK